MYRKKRSYPKKKKYVSKRSRDPAMAVAKRALRLAIGESQLKYTTLDQTGQNVSWTGTTFQPCVPAVGDTDLTRTGDLIHLQNFHMKGRFTSVGTAANVCRIMVFIVNETLAGATPTLTAILQNSATALAPHSPLIWDYRKLYRVLYDKTFNVGNDGVAGGSTQFKINIPLKNLPEQFVAATTTTVKNALQVYILSDANPAGTMPTVTQVNRTTFRCS